MVQELIERQKQTIVRVNVDPELHGACDIPNEIPLAAAPNLQEFSGLQIIVVNYC